MTGSSASFPAETLAAVRERLDRVRAQRCRVLMAIESGSRAWGFPSPDSDYDCRFVYTRAAADHLALEQPRDVIEFPVDGDIDVGGWDLRKALLLALNGNAVIVEWANSPIAYEEIAGFRPRLLTLLGAIVDPAKVAQHYLGLARSHVERAGQLGSEFKLKKLFYTLRPLVALDWMEQSGFDRLPPMSFPDCLQTVGLDGETAALISDLVRRKAATRELGTGQVPAPIVRYLESRYIHHQANMPPSRRDARQRNEDRRLAEAFYRSVVAD